MYTLSTSRRIYHKVSFAWFLRNFKLWWLIANAAKTFLIPEKKDALFQKRPRRQKSAPTSLPIGPQVNAALLVDTLHDRAEIPGAKNRQPELAKPCEREIAGGETLF